MHLILNSMNTCNPYLIQAHKYTQHMYVLYVQNCSKVLLYMPTESTLYTSYIIIILYYVLVYMYVQMYICMYIYNIYTYAKYVTNQL